jgi:hypothetical protein
MKRLINESFVIRTELTESCICSRLSYKRCMLAHLFETANPEDYPNTWACVLIWSCVYSRSPKLTASYLVDMVDKNANSFSASPR